MVKQKPYQAGPVKAFFRLRRIDRTYRLDVSTGRVDWRYRLRQVGSAQRLP
jgi:hypothetical protein